MPVQMLKAKYLHELRGLQPKIAVYLLHLHSGLANNSEPETFSLKYEVEGRPVPCQYIKISECACVDSCSLILTCCKVTDGLGIRL